MSSDSSKGVNECSYSVVLGLLLSLFVVVIVLSKDDGWEDGGEKLHDVIKCSVMLSLISSDIVIWPEKPGLMVLSDRDEALNTWNAAVSASRPS